MFDFFFICYQNIFFFFKLSVSVFFFFLTEFGLFSVVSIMLYVQERVSGHRFVRTKKKKKKARSRGTDGSREGANLFERLLHRLESIGVRAIGRYVLFVTWYALFVQMWPAGSSLGPTVSPSVVWSTAGAVVFI